jgi:glycosyl transferase family 9 (putative heptosyltransferase)
MSDGSRVLFEPWSLGDAVIAAAIWRELHTGDRLACHPAWHPLLCAVVGDERRRDLIPVTLAYTSRQPGAAFRSLRPLDTSEQVTEVLGIRGDLRDLIAARQLFPGASIRMTGWISFLARRLAPLDWVLSALSVKVRNRYRAWAQLAGIAFETVQAAYAASQATAPRTGLVVVHVGAQWRSRQYPQVARLKHLLVERGFSVIVIGGPKDALPAGMGEEQVVRVANRGLVDRLHDAEYAITNDSGPMHVAALLGCRTVVVARMSNIDEWLPPCTTAVRSQDLPIGYRPHQSYNSDRVQDAWPNPEEVLRALPVM